MNPQYPSVQLTSQLDCNMLFFLSISVLILLWSFCIDLWSEILSFNLFSVQRAQTHSCKYQWSKSQCLHACDDFIYYGRVYMGQVTISWTMKANIYWIYFCRLNVKGLNQFSQHFLCLSPTLDNITENYLIIPCCCLKFYYTWPDHFKVTKYSLQNKGSSIYT